MWDAASTTKKEEFFCIKLSLPWRKFRIGIHSESIRTIPNHSDICIRANASQSESIRKTFWISFVEKHLKINPTQSEISLRMNPKWIFNSNESESFLTRIDLNRIFNPNTDSFGLKIYFGFVRIHTDRSLRLRLVLIGAPNEFLSETFASVVNKSESTKLTL